MRTMGDTGVRLQKILSGAGIASRRAAERLIVEGRVSINGQPVTTRGTRADAFPDRNRGGGGWLQTARRGVGAVSGARGRGLPAPPPLPRLARGVVLDGRRTSPAGVRLLAAAPRSSTVELTVHEGRSRQGPPGGGAPG